MVENRPYVTFIAHFILVFGVIIVAFPIWITFVASTHDELRMTQVPLPLLPGTHFFDNLKQVLFTGAARGAKVGRIRTSTGNMRVMKMIQKKPMRKGNRK